MASDSETPPLINGLTQEQFLELTYKAWQKQIESNKIISETSMLDNPPSDSKFFEKFENVKKMVIYNCMLKNIEPLRVIKGLEELELYYDPRVKRITLFGLGYIKGLKKLLIAAKNMSDLQTNAADVALAAPRELIMHMDNFADFKEAILDKNKKMVITKFEN